MKKYGDIFYHRDRYECDFLVRSGRTIVQAVQVTQSLQDDATRQREMRGLVEAMDAHGLDEGTIVTASESAETTVDGRAVHIVPITEWLEEL
jgi:predicted AAA+ superfamily ATPase